MWVCAGLLWSKHIQYNSITTPSQIEELRIHSAKMNANMIRCKNWFCARNNNNDYAEILFGDSNKASAAQQNSTTITPATTTPPTSGGGVVTPDTGSTIRQHHQTVNGKITTAATGNMANHTAVTANTGTGSTMTASHMGNAVGSAGTAAGGAGGGGTGPPGGGGGGGSHVVTFLDDVPSGSNGVVNTTTRLMNHTDLHQQQHPHDHHQMSDDLDVLDTDDFIASQVVSSSLLCDDTLPGSKNCYRLVILG